MDSHALPKYKPTMFEQQVLTTATLLAKMTAGQRLSAHECSMIGLSKDDLIHFLDPLKQLAYDTSLPQPWLDYWKGNEYETVRAGTVWAYPKKSTFGLPMCITQEAFNLVHARKE